MRRTDHALVLADWQARAALEGRLRMVWLPVAMAISTIHGCIPSRKVWETLDFSGAYSDHGFTTGYLHIPLVGEDRRYRVYCRMEPGDTFHTRQGTHGTITGVHVRRVQGITEEEAIACGLIAIPREQWYTGKKPMCDGSWTRQDFRGIPPENWTDIELLDIHDPCEKTAREQFQLKHNSRYAKRGLGWCADPWCWVIGMEVQP